MGGGRGSGPGRRKWRWRKEWVSKRGWQMIYLCVCVCEIEREREGEQAPVIDGKGREWESRKSLRRKSEGKWTD